MKDELFVIKNETSVRMVTCEARLTIIVFVYICIRILKCSYFF